MKKISFLLGLILFIGCKKQDPSNLFEQENIHIEGLTFEQDSIIASLPARVFSPSEIVLENGETIEQFLLRTNPTSLTAWGLTPVRIQSPMGIDKKFQFVSNLFSEGTHMADTLLHPFLAPELPDLPGPEPIIGKQPSQFGYAYVWGSRDLSSRRRAGQCPIWLYGTDCSGMTTLMLRKAGVQIGDYSADVLAKEYTVNTALFTSTNLRDLGYEYEDKPTSFINSVTEGDIIYFKDASGYIFHIGVVLVPISRTDIHIFQSNGTYVSKGYVVGRKNRGCEFYENRVGRGPRCVPLREFVSITDFSHYGILHLGPKKPINPLILGDWTLSDQVVGLKVGNKNVPIVPVTFTKIKFTFNNDNSFHIEAEDKDDPGNPYSCDGVFVMYNNNNNINLSGSCIYEKDNISADIIEINSASFRLMFTVKKSGGITQYITLNLHK